MKTQVLGIILLVGVLAFVSCQKEEDNSIPIPALMVDPPEGSVSTTFTFDATQSYDDQDPAEMLEVRWDWNADGRWDTEWSTEKVAEFNFETCCDHPVKMEIRDSQGWSNMTKTSVKVHKDSIPPQAFFIVINVGSQIGHQKRFDASQTLKNSPESTGMRFRWDFDGDNQWDTDYSVSTETNYTYPNAGVYTVTLEVINSLSLTDTYSREVIVAD
jgi:PKD repeat protein